MALFRCSEAVSDEFVPYYFGGNTENPSGIVPNGTALTIGSLYLNSQVVVLNKKATAITVTQEVGVVREINGVISVTSATSISDPENVLALTAGSGNTVTYTITY